MKMRRSNSRSSLTSYGRSSVRAVAIGPARQGRFSNGYCEISLRIRSHRRFTSQAGSLKAVKAVFSIPRRDRGATPFLGLGPANAFREPRPPLFLAGLGERDAQRARVGDEDDELLAARDGRVEQVARQHHEVLGEQRDHDGRVLAALALVD